MSPVQLAETIDPRLLHRRDLVLVALEPLADGLQELGHGFLVGLLGGAETLARGLEEILLRAAQHLADPPP